MEDYDTLQKLRYLEKWRAGELMLTQEEIELFLEVERKYKEDY